jgi:hypothetical protein
MVPVLEGESIGPTQGFNLLQMGPNWFMWTLHPHIKCPYVTGFPLGCSDYNTLCVTVITTA